MSKVRVYVNVFIEVDPLQWAEAYGLEYATTGPKGSALREDIESHLRGLVQDASREAVERLWAGAEVM